jgi:hypothetical protein
MTTEPINPPEGSSWGDAPPAAAPSAKKGWTGRKTAVAVGVAVLIAAGGGVAIAVGTSGSSSASPAQGQGPGGTGGPGGFGGGARGNFGGGGAAALLGALHGDFVVANPAGGYLTERLQTGSVTALSATSITLTSKDGYKQSYTIDSTTKTTGTPKTGDDVTVVAKVNGTTATATTVGEAAQLQAGAGAGGRRYGGGTRGGAQGAPPTN